MLLWIFIALLTAAAIMAVLAPLGRAAATADADENARRVYLDQLSELERDRAQGRIDATEAEAARAEIARRLLASEAAAPGDLPAPGRPVLRRAVAVAALVGIPLLSLGAYLALGAPGLPGQPLAARLAAQPQANDIAALVARVEARLTAEPEDGRGWDVIAPIYLRMDRAADAANAYRNAIRLLGSDAARQAGLGEALLAEAGGVVTSEAKEAFLAANQADPKAVAPRFFLALAAEQEGNTEAAAQGWRALLAEAPTDAPWRAAVEAALARVEGGAAPAEPSEAEVAAAQNAPPIEHAEHPAMIEGMVAGLAERLRGEPDDVDGWLRLIRSYVVLGRPDEARQAAEAALRGIKDDAERGRVEALLADLRLSPVERTP